MKKTPGTVNEIQTVKSKTGYKGQGDTGHRDFQPGPRTQQLTAVTRVKALKCITLPVQRDGSE